jgi:hypothetical protein
MAAGGLAACGDSFTPVQPLLGQVHYEWQGTVPPAGVMVGLAGLFVPGNAVPPGTILTIRVLGQIAKKVPSGWPLPSFGGDVLQILPEDASFSQPLVFSGIYSYLDPSLSSRSSILINHVFRANDDDAAWTWSAFADGDQLPVVWPIDRPGLWIQGEAPLSSFNGTYRLLRVECGAGPMTTPPSVYLTLAGDHYSLTAAQPPCHDEGAFVSTPFSLTTGPRVLGFDASVSGTSLRLKTGGTFLGTCGAASVGSVVLDLDFSGCATDADCGVGGQCTGELCGPMASTATASCLADVTGTAGGK